uniref:Polymerase III epsilon subunit protein n=1 Tax=Candidatus Giovannonibacteria bacterium GW2011_GWF2_42_19 TaxID=1618659 RepID=A0A0G0ZE73_9BACT|nr:MAG: polymerase III epsilon subunit protein [Candidatus Giovannonibacteria bacterium GW2011_GWF2_42_19]
MKGKEFYTSNSPISFIDLEMTGLEGFKHEIVEIGLVKASQPDLSIIEKWEIKVRPESVLLADPDSLKISGYDIEKWKDAVKLSDAMRTLSEKVKDTILAGFNVATDYAFLDAAVTKTGIPLDFHKRVLDVNSYAVAKLGYEWHEVGLGGLSKRLDIVHENHHTALADATACYKIYRKLRKDFT